MKELTAFDVYSLVKECQFLVGSKIDNIYQTDAKDLYLQIYVKDKPKQLLRIHSGKYFYISSKRPEFPENIQRFCSYLRKYVGNARIVSFDQVDRERIIKLHLDVRDAEYDLFVELFGKGNIVLVKDNKIIAVAEEQLWADRTLKSGEVYKYPPNVNAKELFEKQKSKGQPITVDLLDKEMSSELLQAGKNASAKNKEIERVKNIIGKQSQQLDKVLKETDENKRKGELIYENYEEIDWIIKKIDGLKGKPWPEVKQELKKSKIFKDLKEGKVVVNI